MAPELSSWLRTCGFLADRIVGEETPDQVLVDAIADRVLDELRCLDVGVGRQGVTSTTWNTTWSPSAFGPSRSGQGRH